MTDHEFEQRLRADYRDMVDEVAPASLRANVTAITDLHTATSGRLLGPGWGSPLLSRFSAFALAATAVAVLVLIGIGLLLRPAPDVGPPTPDPARPGASNGWIAYSTAPAADYLGPSGDPDPLSGSDLYLVREGEEPKLIADRDGGDTWNVCPAFSPSGTLLAFGQDTSDGEAIIVVGVDAQGSLTDPNIRLPVAASALAPCPRWSSDGSRIAYLEEGAVVVRGLDGSSPAMANGDPELADFAHSRDSIPAPNGELVARDVGGTIVVERADGFDSRVVAELNAYALAGWSPDSRWILSLQDVSGFHFTMHAISVVEPFETITIVAMVRVNHGRSWPGDGDVSWQPVFGDDPTASPAVVSRVVDGWPGTRTNAAGHYSWNGLSARWMHNPNDEGLGVEIAFSASANPYGDGPTPITVAGYHGTHQERPVGVDGATAQIWIVDMEGTQVTITAEVPLGTTAAELAEAQAIIESIRREAVNTASGFRLVFTLPDGWDSG